MPSSTEAEKRRAREIVGRFLALAGIDDPQFTAEAERRLVERVIEITALGIPESDLAVMGQAYIRAVGRVAAAEAEALTRVRHATVLDHEARVNDLLTRFLPFGREVFDILHGAFLDRTITGGTDRSRRSTAPTAVAHVDVISSTKLLAGASMADTRRLVDGLFAAAQAASRDRGVEVTKYVGDGVFFVGPEPVEVAAASLDCIASLARDSGLSSRAGLAFGRVVHRAGDVFGLPVNLSHVLTKSADRGALLATAVAPVTLPPVMCTRPREIVVGDLAAPVRAYEVAGLS